MQEFSTIERMSLKVRPQNLQVKSPSIRPS